MGINKQLVKNRFYAQRKVYDSEALVQKKVAYQLVDSILERSRKFNRVFEVGCGTGFLTKKLVQTSDIKTYLLNDLVDYSSYFEEYLSERAVFSQFFEGDAEAISFPQNLDLLVSSSAIQWFEDLDSFLSKAHQSLNDQGLLALSTFGYQNYKEIKKLTGIGLDYYPVEQLRSKVSQSFDILSYFDYQQQQFFDTPRAVLNHIKSIGVNSFPKFKWTVKKLKAFEQDYFNIFHADGKAYLTCHPVILIARKKNIL